MTEISFTSTYRIPLSGPKMNKNKKDQLKLLAFNYSYHLFPSGYKGYVRISCPENADKKLESKLKVITKVFQKFSRHCLPVGEIDTYIKSSLKTGDYKQFGKQKKKIHKPKNI